MPAASGLVNASTTLTLQVLQSERFTAMLAGIRLQLAQRDFPAALLHHKQHNSSIEPTFTVSLLQIEIGCRTALPRAVQLQWWVSAVQRTDGGM
jgi:hypothetical protein